MRTRTYIFSFLISVFFFQIISVLKAEAVIQIMPLGNSITNGNSSGAVPDTPAYHVSYRYALWDKLDFAGYDIDFVGSLNTGSTVFGNTDLADHEGHPGWTDDEIVDGDPTDTAAGKLSIWLDDEDPQIVLLHIGTNGLDPSPDDVSDILDVIDAYETANSVTVWVILARIIDRNCSTDSPACPESATTTLFNNNVEDMALDRINNSFNPAFPDKIVIVNMEDGADIDYREQPVGDMANDLHPFETGYAKMADLWFTGLMQILPQADAGQPQTVKETVTVTLDGTGSTDPDGTIVSYLWEEVTTTGVTINNDTATPTATFTAPDVTAAGETLIFRLTVTDNDGLESTDTVSIDVINTVNPVANAGDDQNVTEGATVTLDGSGSSDSDGTIVSYVWEEVTTTGVTINNDTATPTATFTAPDVGPAGATLTFKLTVTDDDGLTSSDTMNVNVAEPLIAVAGDDQNVTAGARVTLDGTASTGPIASYEWIQTAGTPVHLAGTDTATPAFVAPDASTVTAALLETLTFQLTVEDNTGLIESIDTVSVNVADGITPPATDDGGGGCFIGTAANGSQMGLHAKLLRELPGKFAMVNWKRLMAGNISRLTPRVQHTATLPAIVIAMVVLICSWVVITLRKPRKRWLKLFHHDRPKMPIFSKKRIYAYLQSPTRQTIQSHNT